MLIIVYIDLCIYSPFCSLANTDIVTLHKHVTFILSCLDDGGVKRLKKEI